MKASEAMVVIFPGGSGDPKTRKLVVLAGVAKKKGFLAEVIDSTNILNPEHRVQAFLESEASGHRHLILVGSSMGGYVAAVAAETIEAEGLFLIGPVLYLSPYENLDPHPKCRRIAIIHGSRDEVAPIENSKRFSEKIGASLHIIEAEHSLNEHLDALSSLFSTFLDEIIKPNQSVHSTRYSRSAASTRE